MNQRIWLLLLFALFSIAANAETCNPQTEFRVTASQGMNVIDWLRAKFATYLVIDGGTEDGLSTVSCICFYKRQNGAKLACGIPEFYRASSLTTTTAEIRIADNYADCGTRYDVDYVEMFKNDNDISDADTASQAKLDTLLVARPTCAALSPRPVSNIKSTSTTTNSIFLQWTSGLYNQSAKVSYKKGTTAPPVGCADGTSAQANWSTGSLQVTGLTKLTNYTFRVCPVNQYGVGAGTTKTIKTK